MIEVQNKVRIYEVNGKEPKVERIFFVESHWNVPEMVNLKIGDEMLTVSAKDLITAIHNATNSNRY